MSLWYVEVHYILICLYLKYLIKYFFKDFGQLEATPIPLTKEFSSIQEAHPLPQCWENQRKERISTRPSQAVSDDIYQKYSTDLEEF